MKKTSRKKGIPISQFLAYVVQTEDSGRKGFLLKKRLAGISLLAVLVAVIISCIARLLVDLIDLVTNISFYGSFDVAFHSPADNHLGLWVIPIPAIGGLIIGFMAMYGSKAIRGHGIPEAMEQILTNQSRIKPVIAILKPVSSAIAIGSGGPFGAEGPIIATGGALGSTLGQLFRITSNERKILLASGATAGMAAIFGTPIAAVFLAIELLLFEFSPRAILPVALACITGAAAHQILFEPGPTFPMPDLSAPAPMALGIYSGIGILIGFMAIGLTKIVYLIEDGFEKLPIHWLWWPAIAGLAVGVIGYFEPYTLGVGYDNITTILSGRITLTFMLSICLFKLLSWAIALGSGTSGGTLAPLLTIGGAAGAAIGAIVQLFFPQAGISVPMAALIGMSAMFAGASRAYLTSITFALEATSQSHALLPLLGACTASYLISFFFMENTIMTEKIARRGIYTPDSYEPDVLRKVAVAQVLKTDILALSAENTLQELRDFFSAAPLPDAYFPVVDSNGFYDGVVTAADIDNIRLDPAASVSTITKRHFSYIKSSDHLAKAAALLSKNHVDFLPVISAVDNKSVIGVLTYTDILAAYQLHLREKQETGVNLSVKRQRIRILVRGQQLMNTIRPKP
jgi:H+/Cl- antiporter ClcA